MNDEMIVLANRAGRVRRAGVSGTEGRSVTNGPRTAGDRRIRCDRLGTPAGQVKPCGLRRMFAPGVLAAALAALLPLHGAVAQEVPAAGATREFDLPAGDLASALDALATQGGIRIDYRPGLVAGRRSDAVSGYMNWQAALDRLLMGTDLVHRQTGGTSVVIEAAREGTAPADPAIRTGQDTRAPQAATSLAQITVTGTRIRGGTTPSPVITIGAENIREEGFTNLGEVIRSIPQNFSGGQNPGVASAEFVGAGYGNANVTGGSSLNLRGLGPDATLTLLNGRRMSYGGYVQAVDISSIPVEAVERVEIVADGASAIYGSDAVGGVGNVVLKRDLDGAAIGMRLGDTTDGGLATREYAVTAGTSWLNGGLIATYKDVSTDPIHVAQRDYTRHMLEPATLHPGSEFRSGLVSAYQSLGERAELRVDALGTKREQTHYYSLPSGIFVHIIPETRTAFLSPGVDYKLGNDWTLSFGGTKGKDEHVQKIELQSRTLPSPTTLNVIAFCYCNEGSAYDIGAEGPLFELSGGEARLAVGAGYRKNGFRQPNYGLGIMQVEGEEASRSAYAEINLPIVGDTNTKATRRLVITAAARREDYDSFGGVTTPKVGLIYGTGRNVTAKASWGRSFKAPTLFHRYFPTVAGLQFPARYGGAGYPADATVLVLDGGNPDLEPERATTWTASLAFHPQALPGLEAELTWFDVDYTDRVVQPIKSVSQALVNPLYAEFISHNPTPEQQSEVISAVGSFVNSVGAPYDPGKVVAIIRTRYVNATRQRAKGVDLSAAYRLDLAAGQVTMRGSASWLRSSQQTAGTPVPYDLAGTLFNPARFNSRIGAVWNSGGFTGSVFANYKSSVDDSVRNERTGSFLTFDATLRYETGERYGHSPFSGLEVALAAQNLLDNSPPSYVPALPLYIPPYDSTNYSAIGRFVSISIAKRW